MKKKTRSTILYFITLVLCATMVLSNGADNMLLTVIGASGVVVSIIGLLLINRK